MKCPEVPLPLVVAMWFIAGIAAMLFGYFIYDFVSRWWWERKLH